MGKTNVEQSIFLFSMIGEISEKSGGSGGSFGFIYDSDQWKLEEFTTKENAYSLCEFIGKHKVQTLFCSYIIKPGTYIHTICYLV